MRNEGSPCPPVGTDNIRVLKPLLRCPTMENAILPGQSRTNLDQAALLARMQAGDDDAFEACVRPHCCQFLLVARRILGNEEDANDAVQDAFLSAFQGIGQFKEQAQLATWLHRIVVNAALGQLRRRQYHEERSIEDLLPHFGAGEHQIDPPVPWQGTSESIVEQQELCAWCGAVSVGFPKITVSFYSARHRRISNGGNGPHTEHQHDGRQDAAASRTPGSPLAAGPAHAARKPMNCREFTEFLHEYMCGGLPADQRAEFEKHLAECPWCVAYLASYRKTILLEKAAFAGSEQASQPADAPEELIQAILHARSRRW